MDSKATLQPGTILAGKLRIIRTLGRGGMGVVYEVEHELTKHRRAVKLLHGELMLNRPDSVPRFLREASAAGRIGNSHIVETFDAGELPSGEPYIVMEMLHGVSLEEFLEREGRLEIGTAIDILVQACRGVQAAHDAGIVHRDVKPANLFLVGDSSRTVKILDFGVSKFGCSQTTDQMLTGAGSMMGTPLYMAPEQLRGDADVDGRIDVYALGVVLYQCLTGRVPYQADTFPALALRVLSGSYPSIRELRPEVSIALGAVIDRAIEVDRGERFATPHAFSEALLNPDGHTHARLGQVIASSPRVAARSRRKLLWLLASLTALGGLVWLAANWQSLGFDDSPPPAAQKPQVETLSQAIIAANLRSDAGATAPQAEPALAAETLPKAVSAPAEDTDAPPVRSAVSSSRVTDRSANAPPATRAQQKKLIRKNPFDN